MSATSADDDTLQRGKVFSDFSALSTKKTPLRRTFAMPQNDRSTAAEPIDCTVATVSLN
jgi:hypothetical protein